MFIQWITKWKWKMNELQWYLSTWLNLTNIRLKKGSCAWMSIVYHLLKAQESTKQWFVSFQYVSSKSIKTPWGNRLQVMNIGNSGRGWRGGWSWHCRVALGGFKCMYKALFLKLCDGFTSICYSILQTLFHNVKDDKCIITYPHISTWGAYFYKAPPGILVHRLLVCPSWNTPCILTQCDSSPVIHFTHQTW